MFVTADSQPSPCKMLQRKNLILIRHPDQELFLRFIQIILSGANTAKALG